LLSRLQGSPLPKVPLLPGRNETGTKTAATHIFPSCVRIIILEREQVSRDALEPCLPCQLEPSHATPDCTAYHFRINRSLFSVLRINKMLSTAGADRLQTGMRHAYGKPDGTVARARIGQAVMACRTNKDGLKHAAEAPRRASFKFAGKARVVASSKVGFSPDTLAEETDLQAKGGIVECGNHTRRVSRRVPRPRSESLN
jgi:large subunit ribosomal protein L10e